MKEIRESLNRETHENVFGQPNCDLCENRRGRLEVRHTNMGAYDFWVDCSCVRIIKSLKNIKDSGLQDLLKEYRFDNFETTHDFQKQMIAIAKKFVEDVKDGSKSWLTMFGQSGSGKSRLCTSVCGALLDYGKSVTYLRWAVEIKRIKSTVNSASYDHEFDRIFASDIIYIDDFFKRANGAKPTDADVKIAFELVDTAIAYGKVMIISSEDTIDELFNIDEATAGRIKRATKDKMICIGKDRLKNYRLKNCF